ncbi:phosphatidylglycerophosphatase A [Pseudomonas putida S11]|nr:phosphatidylglycerophosphatase A [Pseudomonas putida S11]
MPEGWQWLLAGFLMFRFFDILKPWPIRWVDRHVHGGVGIIARRYPGWRVCLAGDAGSGLGGLPDTGSV